MATKLPKSASRPGFARDPLEFRQPNDPDFEKKHPRGGKGSPEGGRFIRKGDTGEDVKGVQRALGVKRDGKMGRLTVAAVRDFQREHGLQVDGIIGRQTAAALLGSSARAPGKLGPRQRNRLSKLRSSPGRVRLQAELEERSFAGFAKGAAGAAAGAFGAFKDWDPREHPRDVLGQFRKKLGGLEAGQGVRLPDGVEVRKTYGGFEVRRSPRASFEKVSTKKGDDAGREAAKRALRFSARSEDPNSFGGPTSHDTVEQAAKAATPGEGVKTGRTIKGKVGKGQDVGPRTKKTEGTPYDFYLDRFKRGVIPAFPVEPEKKEAFRKAREDARKARIEGKEFEPGSVVSISGKGLARVRKTTDKGEVEVEMMVIAKGGGSKKSIRRYPKGAIDHYDGPTEGAGSLRGLDKPKGSSMGPESSTPEGLRSEARADAIRKLSTGKVANVNGWTLQTSGDKSEVRATKGGKSQTFKGIGKADKAIAFAASDGGDKPEVRTKQSSLLGRGGKSGEGTEGGKPKTGATMTKTKTAAVSGSRWTDAIKSFQHSGPGGDAKLKAEQPELHQALSSIPVGDTQMFSGVPVTRQSKDRWSVQGDDNLASPWVALQSIQSVLGVDRLGRERGGDKPEGGSKPSGDRDYFRAGGSDLRAWAEAGDPKARAEIARRKAKKAGKRGGTKSAQSPSPSAPDEPRRAPEVFQSRDNRGVYHVRHFGGDGQYHLSSMKGGGGVGEGPLARLPKELQPDRGESGYSSKEKAEAAAKALARGRSEAPVGAAKSSKPSTGSTPDAPTVKSAGSAKPSGKLPEGYRVVRGNGSEKTPFTTMFYVIGPDGKTGMEDLPRSQRRGDDRRRDAVRRAEARAQRATQESSGGPKEPVGGEWAGVPGLTVGSRWRGRGGTYEITGTTEDGGLEGRLVRGARGDLGPPEKIWEPSLPGKRGIGVESFKRIWKKRPDAEGQRQVNPREGVGAPGGRGPGNPDSPPLNRGDQGSTAGDPGEGSTIDKAMKALEMGKPKAIEGVRVRKVNDAVSLHFEIQRGDKWVNVGRGPIARAAIAREAKKRRPIRGGAPLPQRNFEQPPGTELGGHPLSRGVFAEWEERLARRLGRWLAS